MKPVGLILDAEKISDIAALARKAEDAGFDSVWATELYRTSFQQLTVAARATSRIRLGTAVALAFVRSPLITSLTALDLDEISNGRLLLGLGTGAKRTNEMWHGITHGKPVTRIKELIEVLRLLTSGIHGARPVQFKGEYYEINTGGYRRPFEPVRGRIPVYLAGVGGRMCRAAGETADGYLGHVVCSLGYLNEVVTKEIEAGLAASGRKRSDFEAASIITCAISNDRKRAMHAARATIAFYATVRTYEPPFKLHGFEKETARIREAFLKGDVDSMIKNVTDDMVGTYAVVGDKAECREKIEEYRELIDLPVLSAPHYFLDFEEVKEYQAAILETFGRR
ncbi:MAG TPA: LLM class flavin-dependent oxidoreductase [Thermodesulfobacteriota bacterium]|nr:LLM class flavin-dependent oxidoreductase [Thermodesulfobacteriota bacterium]